MVYVMTTCMVCMRDRIIKSPFRMTRFLAACPIPDNSLVFDLFFHSHQLNVYAWTWQIYKRRGNGLKAAWDVLVWVYGWECGRGIYKKWLTYIEKKSEESILKMIFIQLPFLYSQDIDQIKLFAINALFHQFFHAFIVLLKRVQFSAH